MPSESLAKIRVSSESVSGPHRDRASPAVASPMPTLGLFDAVALIVGVVVGAGIFRTPSLVAANAGSENALLLAWLFGGVVSLAGALCYAELATTYPNAGGEFHYLARAYGKKLAFLFAWARLTVIPTGSVALMAFIFGDYFSQLFAFSEYSSSIYAAFAVVVLTAINVLGIRQGKRAQKLLTGAELVGVLIVIAAGLLLSSTQRTAGMLSEGGGGSAAASSQGGLGLMMVFVLLTYGGWNDAAYISAEIRGPRRNIARALVLSMCFIATLYFLINLSLIKGLGLEAMARSDTVASDLIQLTVGHHGAMVITLLIALSALTSANATIIMGARSNYALGRDFSLFSRLGRWHRKTGVPINALLAQGTIALALVLLGTLTRKGFQTMVEYTAPVFWLFFFLTGVSVFTLRSREPEIRRPFRVPLYPFTPILFCASSAYLLYSSIAYAGMGTLVGIAVLAVGGLMMCIGRVFKKSQLTN